MLDNGWQFGGYEGATQDPVNNALAQSIRIFNTAFQHIRGNHDDYYPSALKNDITILAI
jgi:putative glutathione S-transferase